MSCPSITFSFSRVSAGSVCVCGGFCHVAVRRSQSLTVTFSRELHCRHLSLNVREDKYCSRPENEVVLQKKDKQESRKDKEKQKEKGVKREKWKVECIFTEEMKSAASDRC